jgi:hypothetical protein
MNDNYLYKAEDYLSHREPDLSAHDRARFDDSLELANTQLAFPVPDIHDEERERRAPASGPATRNSTR